MPSSVPPRLRCEVLSRSFYDRDPRLVARGLLGKILVRDIGANKRLAGRIVETEAYLGAGDAAAHSAAGRTPRNAVLFGPPGHAYVYFIYGNHYCLNASCLGEGNAGCVLIRALEPLVGLAHMAANRGLVLPFRPPPGFLRLLTSGPGRLSEALAITRERDNGKDLAAPNSDLYLASDGFPPQAIAATPRIGITKAAEEPLRFVIVGNPFISHRAR